ncbi:MAG: GSCFA domain-containing protein, partial [Bacteroidales bacterium]|nr:GSCFA domain-containing protein [Bacteroidales bacterium]
FLLITFGTSYVFRWKETDEIVGNCHKIPANQFVRERLTVDEITLTWSKLIKRLLDSNPNLKILFTVSPIRHFKDGAHNNQLSKSILHLSIDNLMHQFPASAFYFPAYEIMMDELRDYRFYTDDMLHPTQLAQNYIWKRFRETYFSKETQNIIIDWKRIHQSLSHRPNNAYSDAYQKFLHRTIEEIEAFQNKYPFISCLKEKRSLTRLIQTL